MIYVVIALLLIIAATGLLVRVVSYNRVRITRTPPAAAQQTAAAWDNKYGYAFKARLIDDFDILQNGIADPSYIIPGCKNILRDVATAKSFPPIPYPQAEKDWQSALNDYANGA